MRRLLPFTFLATLVIFGLAHLGERIIAPLSELLWYTSSFWTGPAESAPIFGLLVLFLAQRVLVAPLQTTHRAVDREKAEVTSMGDYGDRRSAISLFICVVDGVLLCLLPKAAESRFSDLDSWTDIDVFSVGGLSGKWLHVVVFFLASLIVCSLILVSVETIFKQIAGRFSAAPGFTFVGRRDPKDSLITCMVWDVCVLSLVYAVLPLYHASNSFVISVVACYLIAKTVVCGPVQVISCWLDWQNDRWVEELAQQLLAEQDADSRIEAATKLGGLGVWAVPARPNLETARNDIDERVRGLAEKALDNMERRL